MTLIAAYTVEASNQTIGCKENQVAQALRLKFSNYAGYSELFMNFAYGFFTQNPMYKNALFPILRHVVGSFGYADYENSLCSCFALGQAFGIFQKELLSAKSPEIVIYDIAEGLA